VLNESYTFAFHVFFLAHSGTKRRTRAEEIGISQYWNLGWGVVLAMIEFVVHLLHNHSAWESSRQGGSSFDMFALKLG